MAKKKTDDSLYDVRTIQTHIDRGNLKQGEYEKFLKSLPDDEGNYDLVHIEEDPPAENLDRSPDDAS